MTRWVSARSFSEPGPGDGVFAEEQGEESHGGLSLDLSRSGSEESTFKGLDQEREYMASILGPGRGMHCEG